MPSSWLPSCCSALPRRPAPPPGLCLRVGSSNQCAKGWSDPVTGRPAGYNHQQAAPAAVARDGTEAGAGMPPKILIVDDEPDLELLIRQRFRRQIRDGVYDFVFARNGADALGLIHAGGIDLVLSDINMPVMDGLTLLGHLRGLRPRLGTVIVSAYGDMRNIRAAMNLGAFDFLTKPIDFQDFEVTVAKTLLQMEELRQADATRDRLTAVERDLARRPRFSVRFCRHCRRRANTPA